MTRRAALAFALALLAACAGDASEPPPAPGRQAPLAEAPSDRGAPPSRRPDFPERLEVRVVAEYPHDPQAFTQGLVFHDGYLYESTGRYGASELRQVEPVTGEVVLRRGLPTHLFGEGLALVPAGPQSPKRPDGTEPALVQLTWREEVALVWGLDGFERRGELAYRGEGWGLAWDGERLVMGDGSSWLSFREPAGFTELDRVQVTLRERPLSQLNELEWVEGVLWANVWGTSQIVRIDPATGRVTGVADLSELEGRLPPGESGRIDVLNGIAWWPEHGSFLVTGKLWPRLFEVVLE